MEIDLSSTHKYNKYGYVDIAVLSKGGLIFLERKLMLFFTPEAFTCLLIKITSLFLSLLNF